MYNRDSAFGFLRCVKAASALVLGLTGMTSTPQALAQSATPEQPDAGPMLAVAPMQDAGHGDAASGQPQPLRLGMPYVVPPHQPGAKVRTPEGLAPLLAERLGKALSVEPVAAPAAGSGDAPALPTREVDALLLPVESVDAAAPAGVVIPTGYRAGIMGIMRTDTDIRRWEDLRGRTVCIAQGSGLAGQLQARYGAIERVYRAPADALLNLRIGTCDAAVHDSTMLQALLTFPEWKKFSARLPVQQERDLAFVVKANDTRLAQTLRAKVGEWRQSDLLAKLTRQSARDIAFEVYLDQEVPDCH